MSNLGLSENDTIIENTKSHAIKLFTKRKRKVIAFTLLGVCIVVIIVSIIMFYYGNQQHDGWANLLMSCMSYFTTSLALFVALIFLDFDESKSGDD